MAQDDNETPQHPTSTPTFKQGPELEHQHAEEGEVIHPVLPPGGISILSGASGTGKTALLATWVRRILEGKGLFGMPLVNKPDEIAIVITDRNRQGSMYWWKQAGIFHKIRFYCMQDDYKTKWGLIKKTDQHLAAFKDVMSKFGTLPRRTLLIVDPISIFLGGKLQDYSHTAATIGPLNQFITQMGWTCLGAHHTKKLSKDPKDQMLRPQDRILGTTAITGYSYNSLWAIGPEELGERATHYEVGYVAHDRPSANYRFKRDGNGLFLPADPKLLAAPAPANVLAMSPPGEKGQEKFLAIIPTHRGVTAQTLVMMAKERIGVHQSTVYRYLKALVAGGAVAEVEGAYQRLG